MRKIQDETLMTNTISIIPISSLLLILIPVTFVLWIQYKWSLNYKEGIYAISRMLGQLLIVGYFLGAIFDTKSAWLILVILIMMILFSSWIALRTIKEKRRQLLSIVFLSLLIGGGSTLIFVIRGVLDYDPWYTPQYIIPLAGMIFANCMNSVSLATERYFKEIERQVLSTDARNIAFNASMIPITNSLFAVGLVSLPGMMTGQILSGVDPLIAVRYQIMVMAMIFASGGISSAVCVMLFSRRN